MRIDNKIYWNLFQSLFTETTQGFQKRGQKHKQKTVAESKSALQEKVVGKYGQDAPEIAGLTGL